MKKTTLEIIRSFSIRFPMLVTLPLNSAITEISASFKTKNKVLVCGNGGSASDALHIVGELMKGFKLPRCLETEKQKKFRDMFPENFSFYVENLQEALPAISLVSEISLMTAYMNDKQPDLVFAQQVLGYGAPGDILLVLSTSGNSKDVVYAAEIAKVQGMKVISLTGQNGGKLRKVSDILLNVPFHDTAVIQEYMLPVYHVICIAVENECFGEDEE